MSKTQPPCLVSNIGGSRGEESHFATSSLLLSDEINDNKDNNDSDEDEAIVCLILPQKIERLGGMGPPVIFITMIGPIDTSYIEQGRRDDGDDA